MVFKLMKIGSAALRTNVMSKMLIKKNFCSTSRLLTDMKYTKEHEYVSVSGTKAKIGITTYAVGQLGEVVFVELPSVGSELSVGDAMGVIESVKAAADVYAPVSGKVLEVNEDLNDNPSIVNDSPLGDGWLAVIEMSNPSEVDTMMDDKAYEDFTQGL